MTRRVQTLLTGVVFLLVLIVLMPFVRIPYVKLQPGPTVNTLGSYDDKRVIVVDGKEVNKASGNLNLTTVGVVDGITIFDAIAGWFSDDIAVVPRETVYPPDQTRDEIDKQNRDQYVASENSAIVAAMNYLGFPKMVIIASPPKDTPIVQGDALSAINGTPVSDLDQLASLMATIPPGTTVALDYLHFGEPQSTTVVTGEPPKGREGSVLGVTASVRGYGGFNVSFPENDIGGPSAGLMLTLGIIQLVGPDPLITDQFVAGTGTIDAEGTVGPIGGIRFKIKMAAEVGADIFLTPADNCAEALQDPPDDGPKLVKVTNLDDAVEAIKKYEAGESLPLCS